jgi:hygromycin-B 7''-O-kinase
MRRVASTVRQPGWAIVWKGKTMPKDTYLQPDKLDPVLDADVVLALARRHIPGARAVTTVDETGGEARTYAIDDDVIFKTQRPHRLRPRTSQAKEVLFLHELARLPDIPVPRVLGYGKEGDIEYTVLTRMPGIAVRRVMLDTPARQAMLHDLGRVLRRIHAIPQAEMTASGLFPGDRTADDFHARIAEAFDDAIAAVRVVEGAWGLGEPPEDIAKQALAVLPKSEVRAALHSNPAPEHTFVDERTGRYTGTIDFGDAYISHPTLDLRRWRDPADREALFAGYVADVSVDDAFLAVWRVVQVLTDMMVISVSSEHRAGTHEHLQTLTRS